MRAPASLLRTLLVGCFGLYLAMYPGSVFLVALDLVPAWGTWIGGALIILQGTTVWLWLGANYGWRGALAGLLIAAISAYAEYLGDRFGFLFGNYDYTPVLAPHLAGVVPLAIPFAWVLVIPSALWAAKYATRPNYAAEDAPRRDYLALLLNGAGMAVLLDIGIEPVATLINGYWVWTDNGAYYGVPTSNFLGWWALSLLLTALLLVFILRPGQGIAAPRVYPQIPQQLYLLNTAMFGMINLAHGQFFAAAVGALVLLFIALARLERPLVHWVLTGEPPLIRLLPHLTAVSGRVWRQTRD